MATATRKLAPVTGSAKWNGSNELTIRTERIEETYAVRVGNGGFVRLGKADGTVYEVQTVEGVCSCPDQKYNRRECKHVKALKAALCRRPTA